MGSVLGKGPATGGCPGEDHRQGMVVQGVVYAHAAGCQGERSGVHLRLAIRAHVALEKARVGAGGGLGESDVVDRGEDDQLPYEIHVEFKRPHPLQGSVLLNSKRELLKGAT